MNNLNSLGAALMVALPSGLNTPSNAAVLARSLTAPVALVEPGNRWTMVRCHRPLRYADVRRTTAFDRMSDAETAALLHRRGLGGRVPGGKSLWHWRLELGTQAAER